MILLKGGLSGALIIILLCSTLPGQAEEISRGNPGSVDTAAVNSALDDQPKDEVIKDKLELSAHRNRVIGLVLAPISLGLTAATIYLSLTSFPSCDTDQLFNSSDCWALGWKIFLTANSGLSAVSTGVLSVYLLINSRSLSARARRMSVLPTFSFSARGGTFGLAGQF